MLTDIVRTRESVRAAIKRLRQNRKRIALVPTMGALHAGHLSLVETARRNADAVAVSVFVNPAQFGPGEDFTAYPRPEKEDIAKLTAARVEVVYLPDASEMYPEGFCARVQVPRNTDILCGAFRPGHFDGVATVVAKLFHQCQPDVAVFGEKDYQQLWIIRKMVADLDLPIDILGAPVVREEDGLAMSSRNAYLSPVQRKIAAALYRTLEEMREAALRDPAETLDIMARGRSGLLAAGFDAVDYLELRDANTLEMMDKPLSAARLLAAARIGKTRLIDNVAVEGGK